MVSLCSCKDWSLAPFSSVWLLASAQSIPQPASTATVIAVLVRLTGSIIIPVWRRPVRGIREMCDTCVTSLFNFHWLCPHCGFCICSACHKAALDSGDGMYVLPTHSDILECTSEACDHCRCGIISFLLEYRITLGNIAIAPYFTPYLV